jgi:hypothetical protein
MARCLEANSPGKRYEANRGSIHDGIRIVKDSIAYFDRTMKKH